MQGSESCRELRCLFWFTASSSNFSSHIIMEILVQEVESYLESGCMCEIACAKSVQFGRNQQKTLLEIWKCGLTTFYKTISNINFVFRNCLQMRYILAFFHPPWMVYWLVKRPYLPRKKKIFSNDFETGIFNIHKRSFCKFKKPSPSKHKLFRTGCATDIRPFGTHLCSNLQQVLSKVVLGQIKNVVLPSQG